MVPPVLQQRTSVLDVAYEDTGAATGTPVVLLHGFPYDPRAFDDVVARVVTAGCRAIVPYLRGFGATRFVADATPRSGQQAALGNDLRELLDALGIARAVLAGYDWGGRAACVVAALWPERTRGLVTVSGYNVHDIAGAAVPASPAQEHRYWYQYYFHSERGRAGLAVHRRELCRLLWQQWSPRWGFSDAVFERTAPSFDNPDFVDVVVQSYRQRYGYAAGDPGLAPLERRLAAQPSIAAPTIVLEGEDDGVRSPDDSLGHGRHFTGPYERHVIARVGHNLPQEAPEVFADAVLSLVRATA